MLTSLIILAGGSGLRLINSSKVPKQYISIGSNNIIEYFLENLEKNIFDIIFLDNITNFCEVIYMRMNASV